MHIGKVVELTGNRVIPRLNIDIDHSLNTFKIYALDSNGNIMIGKVNAENLKILVG